MADAKVREQRRYEFEPGLDAVAGAGDGGGAAEARPVDVDYADAVFLGEGVLGDVEIPTCGGSCVLAGGRCETKTDSSGSLFFFFGRSYLPSRGPQRRRTRSRSG